MSDTISTNINLFTNLPDDLKHEVFQTLVNSNSLRIERIISKGHSSPNDFWYDQDEHEWVLVVKGEAILAFETQELHLKAGDYCNILAHTKHRVVWTATEEETIWLAIFYKP